MYIFIYIYIYTYIHIYIYIYIYNNMYIGILIFFNISNIRFKNNIYYDTNLNI